LGNSFAILRYSHVQENMRFIFAMTFLFSSVLLAEPQPPAGDAPESSGRAELTIKRQSYKYIPFQQQQGWIYYGYGGNYNGRLSGNTDIVFPISFNYLSASHGWGLGISYFKDILAHGTYDSTYYSPGSTLSYRTSVLPLTRAEIQANAYKYFNPFTGLRIGIGGGLRSINTYEAYDYYTDYYRRRIDTYGPQIGIPVYLDITPRLQFLALGQLFITRGKVISESAYAYGNYISKTWGPSGVHGIYYGGEYELRLSYSFMPNFALAVGYDAIDSLFEYQHYYLNQIPAYSSSYPYSSSVYSYRRDLIKGFYAAVTVGF